MGDRMKQKYLYVKYPWLLEDNFEIPAECYSNSLKVVRDFRVALVGVRDTVRLRNYHKSKKIKVTKSMEEVYKGSAKLQEKLLELNKKLEQEYKSRMKLGGIEMPEAQSADLTFPI